MNTFQKWASDQLKSIETALQVRKESPSLYLVDKISYLKAGIWHGDELQYELNIAILDQNEQKTNEILAAMRERDLAGAGTTRTAQEIAAAIVDNELKRSAM